ncbi:MAG TPA: MlaD family protein [Gemmatimonadaceae bacterium]|jgi:phospholipid/cholesterol/gamma-HCH transport system substrate-binding protein|nr:MlaD family protein [Gemmatimonadaceae bacterium]
MKRATFITWEQLKVGGMILLALAILTVAVVKLGEAANLFSKRYKLVVLLPSANGLRVGGTVTVAGQLAGTVASIDFLPPDADTTRNLKVIVEVDQALQQQVREDSRARLRTLGLLGDKIVDISPGTPRYAVLPPNDTLRVEPALDYEAVLIQASAAVNDMVQLTRDLKGITGGMARGEGTVGQLLTNRSLYDELNGTLARTNALVTRLQAPNGSFAKLLDDPALYQNLNGMIGSVDSLVRQMRSENGTLGKLLTDDTLYTHLVAITAGADSLVKQVTRGNGFAAKLVNDQQLYEQLTKTITDLNAILADVRQNPRKYTKGMIKVF